MMNADVNKTHNKPLKASGTRCTAIYEDGWINVHPKGECAQNGSERGFTAMCDFGEGTRPAYGAERIMTGYGSKSRKAVMMPRGNGKSEITAVKFLMDAFGRKKASEIIAEVKGEIES